MKKRSKLAIILIISLLVVFLGCSSSDNGDNGDVTYAIGDTGPSGVGIVFYITDGGLHGLEAAPNNQGADQAWSTITWAYANGATALPPDIGEGSTNTDAIIAQNSGAASAAKECRDYAGGGLTDWFLPSKDELNELYTRKDTVGGFGANSYWSSSEDASNDDNAWFHSFGNGTQSPTNKGGNLYVRPIRAF